MFGVWHLLKDNLRIYDCKMLVCWRAGVLACWRRIVLVPHLLSRHPVVSVADSGIQVVIRFLDVCRLCRVHRMAGSHHRSFHGSCGPTVPSPLMFSLTATKGSGLNPWTVNGERKESDRMWEPELQRHVVWDGRHLQVPGGVLGFMWGANKTGQPIIGQRSLIDKATVR